MRSTLLRFWKTISYLGVDRNENADEAQMIQIFFNKCLAIGFIGMVTQTFYTYIFIGIYGVLNLISALAIIAALYIHSKGYFAIAKRVSVYVIFATGVVLTMLSGGDFLYHIGVITILAFSWILFDPKTERIELMLFFTCTLLIYFIGEFNPFNAPDFTQHPSHKLARFVGLIMYTSLVTVFIYFIRTLNVDYAKRLSKALSEKDCLMQSLTEKSSALELEKSSLEQIVSNRTQEIRVKNEVLERQNKEKEVLLKEVHHRVKNNLQIIVSLLNLQASSVNDADVLLAIRETQNRIISMSLVHQRIYEHSSYDAILFKDYIELLIENNQTLFADKMVKVDYQNSTSHDLKISIDSAIPLGLIINEMLTNSFKHAFTDTTKAYQISIQLVKLDDNSFSLTYEDNGSGLPANLTIENSNTLGIQLMDALASQIDGELDFYNKDGAVLTVKFKKG